MRRGERAPSDIPLENKQNKSGPRWTGIRSRSIKLTSVFCSFSSYESTRANTFPSKNQEHVLASTAAEVSCTSISFILTFSKAQLGVSLMQLAGYLWWIRGVRSLPVAVWSDRREGCALRGTAEEETGRCTVTRSTLVFCYTLAALPGGLLSASAKKKKKEKKKKQLPSAAKWNFFFSQFSAKLIKTLLLK